MSEKNSKNTAPLADGMAPLASDDPLEVAQHALEVAGEALVTAQEAAAGAAWANVNAQSALDQSEIAQEQAAEAKEAAQEALEVSRDSRELAQQAKDLLVQANGAYVTRVDQVEADDFFLEPAKMYVLNEDSTGFPVELPAYCTVAVNDGRTSAFQVIWNDSRTYHRTADVIRCVNPGTANLTISLEPVAGAPVDGALEFNASDAGIAVIATPGSFAIDAAFPTVLRASLSYPLQGAVEGTLNIQGAAVATFKNGVAALAAAGLDAGPISLEFRGVRLEGGEIVLDLLATWTDAQEPAAYWHDWTAWGENSNCPSVYTTLDDAVDANDLCDVATRYFIINNASQNFPVTTPLYCETMVDDRAVTATQFVWNLEDAGVYMRTWYREPVDDGQGTIQLVDRFSDWKTCPHV